MWDLKAARPIPSVETLEDEVVSLVKHDDVVIGGSMIISYTGNKISRWRHQDKKIPPPPIETNPLTRNQCFVLGVDEDCHALNNGKKVCGATRGMC